MADKKRLIDADALIERFRIFARSGGPVVYHNSEICAVIGDEANEEAVDAVEVVRCKDCCHYRKATDWDGESYYACHKRAAVLIMQMNKDDFCSYGERKK